MCTKQRYEQGAAPAKPIERTAYDRFDPQNPWLLFYPIDLESTELDGSHAPSDLEIIKTSLDRYGKFLSENPSHDDVNGYIIERIDEMLTELYNRALEALEARSRYIQSLNKKQ